MITTIVFDIGNVLAHFGWTEYLHSCGYNEDMKHRISNATVESSLWREWDRGSREASELVELCCKENPDIETQLREFFRHAVDMVKEYDYSPELVKQLKKNGYHIYVLSNYSKANFEEHSKNFKFIEYIDGGIVSYQVNYIKPEAAIYEALINKYNINPSEAVFIDDVEANLEGAKPFGFHTILMQSYDKLIPELKNLGIRID